MDFLIHHLKRRILLIENVINHRYMAKYMLKIKVVHLYLALFLMNCVVSLIIFIVPLFLFFTDTSWNTSLFRMVLFFLSLLLISAIDFQILYRKFINVRPSASFAYPFDDGPWLHFIDDPAHSVVINWISKEKGEGIIRFGESESTMEKYVLQDHSRIHRRAFTGLLADHVYYYQIQERNTVYSFKTPSDCLEHVVFALVGDTQNGGGLGDPNWAFPKLVDAIQREPKLDLLLHVGDLTDQGNDLRSWHAYFDAAKNLLSRVPMHVAVGNHDTGTNYMHDKAMKKYPDEGANFDYLLGYKYAVPAAEDQTTSFKGRYYSFKYGHCLFLMLDTQNSKLANPDNPQWEFIKTELNSVPDHVWKIICVHRDLVDIQKSQTGEIIYHYDKFSRYICPILHEYGADIVFQGHDHIFQFLSWKYSEEKAIYAPVRHIKKIEIPYITSGGAGNELRRNLSLKEESKNVDSVVITEDSSHYLLVEIGKEICTITAKYDDGSVLHQFSIRK